MELLKTVAIAQLVMQMVLKKNGMLLLSSFLSFN
jgi:hypothetical protein